MKRKYLLSLFGFLYFILIYSYAKGQTVETRVGAIRKMYAEVQGLLKNTSSLKCSNAKWDTYEGLNEESEKVKFNQIVTKCDLPKGYQYYKAEYTGYEWYTRDYIYFFNGKPFFVLLEFGGEGCSIISRLYYNESGKIIKYLESKENCDEGNGSKEIKDKKQLEDLEKQILSDVIKIQSKIKNKVSY